MQKVNAALPELTRAEAVALDAGLGRTPSVVDLPALGGFGLARRFRAFVSRLTDTQLALAISAVLFALSAWPLVLTEVPPYQDLPNHLAAVTVISHPGQYPEFAFNGFLKTNAALFTWLFFVGKVAGVKVAARLFALLVVAMNALVLPRFVLTFTNRKRLLVASFFVWPMIHNWFVSMGMLDFALGVPLSLCVLILLHRQRQAPSWKNAVFITGLAVLTWYAHVFTLLVVHLLALVEIGVTRAGHWTSRASWSARYARARALLVPLLPATALVAASLVKHITEPRGEMVGFVGKTDLLPLWELGYNLWAEWFYGFTWLSIATLVPCIALGLIAIYRRRESVPFFSQAAFWILVSFYFFTPYITTNWFHVNSRFIPFLWMAALVRLPDRLPRKLLAVLAVGAVSYSIAMGVDFVRLDRDRARFTAGMAAVPEHSKLLPLIFRGKGTSENTSNLLHAWGFYVMEKQTSAPLLFAHSRSFPVVYREAPPPQFNHLVLQSWAPNMSNPDWMCSLARERGVVERDCDARFAHLWSDFWSQVEPVYDRVLMWAPTPEALAQVPSSYKLVFREDKLSIFARVERPQALR